MNLLVSGNPITFGVLIIPALIGLSIGLLVGFNRKKWLSKCTELDDAAEELARQLVVVQQQKDHSDNLQRLVSNIPLPIYLKDQDHRYLLVNSHFENLAGKQWSELKGQTDYEVFPKPVADLFREQDQDVMGAGGPRTFEETVPLKSGIITFETFKFPLVNNLGNIYALGGVCTDITQLKVAEDQLKAQQKRLDTVLKHLDVGVITTDATGQISMFNQKASEFTGLSIASAIGSNLENIYQVQDARSGAAVHLDPAQEHQDPDLVAVQDVNLTQENGRALKLIQKTIPLLDGFGQHTGLLIVLNEKTGTIKPVDQYVDLPQTPDPDRVDSDKYLAPVGRILVMDDDRLVRKTTQLMLGRGGYEVLTAKNGEEAISIYREQMNTNQPINAIIMDLTVPGGMGGVEATEKIIALDPKARIIVASGYSNNPIMSRPKEYGFRDVLKKPFTLRELREIITKYL